MNELQFFCIGVIVGCLMGAVEMWRMNNRWYRRSIESSQRLAAEIATSLAIRLRVAAANISDRELSDALVAEADEFDRMWKK